MSHKKESVKPRVFGLGAIWVVLCAGASLTAGPQSGDNFRYPDPPREGEARFFPVAEGGEARCVLVYEEGALAVARELGVYLRRVTGASFKLLADGAPLPEGMAAIHIGETAVSAGVPPGLPDLQYGADIFPNSSGYRIHTPDNQTLIIRGNTTRALNHGVVGFLERYAGVRQYWECSPGSIGEVVPSRPDLWIPEVDWSDWPYFYSRWLSQRPFTKARGRLDFFRRNGVLSCGESYYSLLPPARYRDTNPEYYALVGGRRLAPSDGQTSAWQPCLSNPAVAEIMAEAVLDAFRKNPDLTGKSVSINDGARDCECEECRAWDTPGAAYERRMSDRYVRFTNLVCERVEKEFPDRHIVFLAYAATRGAPLTVVPHGRLLPVLTVSNTFKAWDEWTATGVSHMGVYLHHDDTLYFLLPRMDVRQMARRIKYITGTGKARIFYMEAYPHWPISGLIPYLAARLVWDPRQDPVAILDEFYDLFFGAAAAPMKVFYDTLADGYEEWLVERGLPYPAGRDITSVTDGRTFRQFSALSLAGAERAAEALKEAEEAAAGEELPALRVEAVKRLFDLIEPAVESYWLSDRLRGMEVRSEGEARFVSETTRRLFDIALMQSNHIAQVSDNNQPELWGATFVMPDSKRPIAMYEEMRRGRPLPEVLTAIRNATEAVSEWLRTEKPAGGVQGWWNPLIAEEPYAELRNIFELARLHGAAPAAQVLRRSNFDKPGNELAPPDLDILAGAQEIVLDSQLPPEVRKESYIGQGHLKNTGVSVYAWHADRTPFTLALTRQDTPDGNFAMVLRHAHRMRITCYAPLPREGGRKSRVTFNFRRSVPPGSYTAEVAASNPGSKFETVAKLHLPEEADVWHKVTANIELPEGTRTMFMNLFVNDQAEEATCWIHDIVLSAYPE